MEVGPCLTHRVCRIVDTAILLIQVSKCGPLPYLSMHVLPRKIAISTLHLMRKWYSKDKGDYEGSEKYKGTDKEKKKEG